MSNHEDIERKLDKILEISIKLNTDSFAEIKNISDTLKSKYLYIEEKIYGMTSNIKDIKEKDIKEIREKNNEIQNIIVSLDLRFIHIEKNIEEIKDNVFNIKEKDLKDLQSSDGKNFEHEKQQGIDLLKIVQIKENVEEVKEDIKNLRIELREKMSITCENRMRKLEEIIIEKVENTNDKIKEHIKEKIEWKKIALTTSYTFIIMFIVFLIFSLIDSWMGFGIIKIIMNFI